MKSLPFGISIFVGIIISMLAGCHNATDSALASADALMDSDPAKAQSILDAIKVDSTDLERKMLHALLKEKAVIKQHLDIESDSMADIVMRYYEGRKDSLEVLSKLYYGMALRQHGKYEEAMVPLIFAYDLADKLNEYRSAGLAACELCFIYNRFYGRQDELYWAELQKYQFNKGSLPLHTAWADLDLIEALAHNGRVDEAQHLICYLDSLHPDDTPAFLSQLNLYRPWIEYLQDNPHESLQLYEEALDKGCHIGSNVWYIIGKNYIRIGEREKAVSALVNIRPTAKKTLDSIWAIDLEARIAAYDHDFRRAYEKASEFGRSMMAEDDKRISHPVSSALIESLRSNYILEQEVSASERREKMFIIIVALLLTVIFTALLLWVLYLLKAKRKEKEMAEMKVDMLNKEVDSLNEKADMKEREVTEKIQALLKERMIPLNRLCEAWFRNPEGNVNNKGALIKELENLRSDESIAELERVIDEYSHDWMKRFRATFPSLTKDQYQFVIYLFSGFSNESIAILMDKNINALYGVKSRLKNKLAGNDSAEAKAFMIRLGLC